MHSENSILLGNFIESFTNQIERFNKNEALSSKILNKTEMTKFYKTELFPQIAKDLKLEMSTKEFLRIDIYLYKNGVYDYDVPYILIESENDPNGELPKEIHKLLSVNSPLKVLLTRTSLESEIEELYKGHENTHWYYPIQSFAEFNRLVGYFLVMSAEWDINQNLCYKYIVYDEKGSRGEVKQINLNTSLS